MITCPDCNGSGVTKHTAFDIEDRIHVYVTELAYQILPDNEDAARYQGKRFCKGEPELCRTCRGKGEISEEY